MTATIAFFRWQETIRVFSIDYYKRTLNKTKRINLMLADPPFIPVGTGTIEFDLPPLSPGALDNLLDCVIDRPTVRRDTTEGAT